MVGTELRERWNFFCDEIEIREKSFTFTTDKTLDISTILKLPITHFFMLPKKLLSYLLGFLLLAVSILSVTDDPNPDYGTLSVSKQHVCVGSLCPVCGQKFQPGSATESLKQQIITSSDSLCELIAVQYFALFSQSAFETLPTPVCAPPPRQTKFHSISRDILTRKSAFLI